MRELRDHCAAQRVLARGLLSLEQLQAAYSLRDAWPKLSLSDLLLLFGYLRFDQLAPLLAELHPEREAARMLVRRGELTSGQLEEAMSYQEEAGGELGPILEALGHLRREVFESARQRHERRQERRLPTWIAWRPRVA